MMHFTCDMCGKEISQGDEQRYVVKIEAFAAQDPAVLTEADLDDDHMEAVSEMLLEQEEGDGAVDLPAATKHFRYDLCAECHQRFVRDPLSKEHLFKLSFSKN